MHLCVTELAAAVECINTHEYLYAVAWVVPLIARVDSGCTYYGPPICSRSSKDLHAS